jgi:hypothetical protein
VPAETNPPERDVSALDAGLVCCLLAACLVAGASTSADPDMLHLLALARETLTRGALPLHDPFAFTPTRVPVVNHEWLVGIILYRVIALGGATGLLVAKYGLHAVALGTSFGVARRLGASLVTLAFLGPLGIAMSLPGMTTVRSQAFTLAFVGATLWCLDLDRRGGRRWMLAFVPMCVLWVNCHGGWVVGWGLVVLHAIEQAIRRVPVRHLGLLVLLLPLVSLATPYGLAYPRVLVEALTLDRSMIGEWRRLGEAHALALPVWGLSLVVFAYGFVPAGPRAVPGWLLVMVTALLAFRHERHVSLYALVWLAHVPPTVESGRLGRAFHGLWAARPMVTRAVLVLGIAAAVLHAVGARRWEVAVDNGGPGGQTVIHPVGAVDYLHAHGVHGRLTTPFEQGAYVMWKLSPDVRVSLDSRFEAAYPPGLVEEHVAFYGAQPTWHAFLERYPSDLVLARRTDAIVAPLEARAEWPLVYEDDAFLLFARPGLSLPYVDRRGERIVGRIP